MSQSHPTFELLRSHRIDSLNLDMEEYRHRNTGAMHYHLSSDNNENVFLVALRTVPHDSTGVAHILEHTALCGSERYPVRDPFFMMIRRSLNTFMNAFTSSDWTAYPFASQNRKDFDNLLSVYLDAVFFSRLDPLDFAQEGHRLEFADPDDANSDLVFKGVVFNEMKGAMSSVTSTLWHTLCKYLFPTTTYHYNSGGDPEHITDLSYQQLQDFYRSHYHPSNAIFMTYGDIPAAEHQQKFEEQALNRFEALDEQIAVGFEKRYFSPIRVQESYAYTEEGNATDKTHVVMAWLLGESTHLDELMAAQLLSSVLLDNSASPLQNALETTELGNSPSPLCGLEDSMRELVFACGLEGAKTENAGKIEQLILVTLEQVANEGIAKEQLEAMLHQLELSQREIGGDGYPFGLQLILNCLNGASHRGDPIALLDIDAVINRLRENIQKPEYIKNLVRKLLLNNQHRVTLIMSPDSELSNRRNSAEKQQLQKIKASLDDNQKSDIIEQAKALKARQAFKDDESVLPKVGLEDIKADIPEIECQQGHCGELPVTRYAQGTNGLVYQQYIASLPDLTDEETQLLPFYCDSLTELGIGENDYLAIQQRQSQVCGSIHAFNSMRSDTDDEQQTKSYFVLSSKALARNHREQTQLMHDTLHSVRFNEHQRLRELVSQKRARSERSIPGNGHGLAMAAACSEMSPLAFLSHQTSGLAGIKSLKAFDDSLAETSALSAYAEALETIHQKMLSAPSQLLLIGENDLLDSFAADINAVWKAHRQTDAKPLTLDKHRSQARQLWLTNTEVSFCAKAYPTVSSDHADAPALAVLGGFLRNGFLHQAIREQGGAYGGGASQDNNIAAFRFFSYRDPRVEGTLEDFDQSITWMLQHEHSDDQLEQAILGVIGSIDKPGSPAGEAKQHFHNSLFGRTHAQRQQFRLAITQVTLDDLLRVTRTYLKPENASIAVITNAETAKNAQGYLQSLQLTEHTL